MDKNKEIKPSRKKEAHKPVVEKLKTKKKIKVQLIPGGKPPRGMFNNVITGITVLLLIVAFYSLFAGGAENPAEIAVSELAQDVASEKVTDITVKGNTLDITYVGGEQKFTKKETGVSLTDTLVNYGVTTEQLGKVKIDVKGESGFLYWLLQLSPIIIPILFILFFVWFLSRQVKSAGGAQAFTFGQSKARMIDPNDKKNRITFKDVAGAKEAKEELEEVADFLRNPKKFLEIGAQIPKGILLMGAPGTGKTLLARAVAGEAGVNFFSISGSEFVEMFVGVGASRVRDLFNMAKNSAPAIIFVDEIDAVGRSRGTGVGGGNDEREQTLNQILVEMDGFEPNAKVIVMAATNRPDVLDPALLRPGRFDRRVTIDVPDRKDREEILKIHARKKPLAEDVVLKVIAERTPGFSGADLYSLMNEAAILAARENRKTVAQYDMIRSIEKVMLGPERKSHILSKQAKKVTAYHEAGHAVLASVLDYADPVHKISIISRGRAAGYVLKLPLDDKKLQSKKEFLDDIVVSLGGYVVEKMYFDDLTTGPSNDLQVSSSLARDMVTLYGMSDEVGPVALESKGRTLSGSAGADGGYSQEMSSRIDSEVKRIMTEAMNRAETLVKEHKKLLEIIANRLIEVETIERAEFEQILVANGVELKQKKDLEHQN